MSAPRSIDLLTRAISAANARYILSEFDDHVSGDARTENKISVNYSVHNENETSFYINSIIYGHLCWALLQNSYPPVAKKV